VRSSQSACVRDVPRLAVWADTERTDPAADDRQPRQRAEGLRQHQQDQQEARGRGKESGDDERSDQPDGAAVEGHRSVKPGWDVKGVRSS
jgi:hypothetical protein